MASTASLNNLVCRAAATLLVGALWGCSTVTSTPMLVGADASTDAVTDAAVIPPTDAPPAVDAAPVADVSEPPVMADSCDAFQAGTVSGFMVDGMAREFIITLPPGATAAGGHWPVVFNWHGLGDTAPNMNQLLSGQAANATFPFILVTPESTHLGPTTVPVGLDWDEIQVMNPNREAHLFDAVLQCVDQRWGVDRDRVFTVGFSAGGIMSDLLGVLRGDQLAGVVSYSGGYFADPANPMTLGAVASLVSWPDLTTTNRYPQLMLYGGTSDTFSLVVATAHFDQFARNDAMFLNGMGHDVILCNHGGGHRIPSAVMGRQLVEFFSTHHRGMGASPWSAGLPTDFPAYCAFQGHTGAM